MKRVIGIRILIILGLLDFGVVFGQDKFTFPDVTGVYNFSSVDPSLVKDHFLGEKTAYWYYFLDKTYTYVQQGTPTDPSSKTIVKKPVIYYAIKKINRDYKKKLKKGEIDEATAQQNMNLVLKKAISIFDQNTEEIESLLKDAKGADEIEQVFARIELK